METSTETGQEASTETGVNIEVAVWDAQNGSREALEQVVSYAQGYVYNLALRMLQLPADAEDATQEIMIKLITHLAEFRGESAFATWMYRLATNALLNIQQRSSARRQISFEDISERIEFSLAHQSSTPEEIATDAQLIEEVRRGCTLGMLQALGQEDRMVLILAELLYVANDEGAHIMNITPAAYRQRLSRARRTLVDFVSRQCGIINPDSPCRCHKHVSNKLAPIVRGSHELDDGLHDDLHDDLHTALQYAQPHDAESTTQMACAAQPDLDAVQRGLALFRAHPVYTSRADFHQIVNQLFAAGNPDA